MRITAGIYKNKKLFSPLSDSVRPTMEKAKEALFSILKSKLQNFENLSFLDVFAGSGSMGFEALSRGFSDVCFIDLDTATLNKNAKLFKEDIKIIKADATNLPPSNKCFDVVFLDAPYHKGLSQRALTSLKEKGWLKDDTIVIVELAKDENIEGLCGEERIYGLNKFVIMLPSTC